MSLVHTWIAFCSVDTYASHGVYQPLGRVSIQSWLSVNWFGHGPLQDSSPLNSTRVSSVPTRTRGVWEFDFGVNDRSIMRRGYRQKDVTVIHNYHKFMIEKNNKWRRVPKSRVLTLLLRVLGHGRYDSNISGD